MEELEGLNEPAEAARAGEPPDVTIHIQEGASHGQYDEAARAGQPPGVAIHLQEAARHGPQASPPPSCNALGIGEYLQPYDSKRDIFSKDGVMYGSYQELLMDATTVVLDFNVEVKAGSHCGLIESVQPAHIVACDSQNVDDGYSTGEECNDDNSLVDNLDSDLEDTPGYKESTVDRGILSEGFCAREAKKLTPLVSSYGCTGDDIDDCFGSISDSEVEVDNADDRISDEEVDNAEDRISVEEDLSETIYPTSSNEGIPATVLGDCGCVSNHGNQCIGIDEKSDSGSDDEDESDDEEEIIPVTDLQQEIYVDKAQVGVPYRKRKRYNGTAKRPNCRKARMMGAVERALRSSSTRTTEHIFEPVLGMVFDSREEAKEFYNLYSWEVGFGVKFNTSCGTKSGCRTKKDDINTEEEYRSMQDIVCQKSGYDDRVKNRTKRCGCPAKIHLLRTDDYGWYISSIVKEHNHPLSETCGEKRVEFTQADR